MISFTYMLSFASLLTGLMSMYFIMQVEMCFAGLKQDRIFAMPLSDKYMREVGQQYVDKFK